MRIMVSQTSATLDSTVPPAHVLIQTCYLDAQSRGLWSTITGQARQNICQTGIQDSWNFCKESSGPEFQASSHACATGSGCPGATLATGIKHQTSLKARYLCCRVLPAFQDLPQKNVACPCLGSTPCAPRGLRRCATPRPLCGAWCRIYLAQPFHFPPECQCDLPMVYMLSASAAVKPKRCPGADMEIAI